MKPTEEQIEAVDEVIKKLTRTENVNGVNEIEYLNPEETAQAFYFLIARRESRAHKLIEREYRLVALMADGMSYDKALKELGYPT